MRFDGLARYVIASLLAGVLATGAFAQDGQVIRSPVLVIDSERLYRDSNYGQRIAAEVTRGGEELAAENRRIEAELAEEEKSLTEQRPSLEPDEFRRLADAFDEKVRKIRRQQETKARAVVQRQDDARAAFLQAAAPVLEGMMRDAGAAIVLERRDVFLSVNAIDITEPALVRINAEIGDGAGAPAGSE